MNDRRKDTVSSLMQPTSSASPETANAAIPPVKAPQVTLLTATNLVIANMVGIGIFTSLGFQVKDLPSGFTLLFLWLIGGICALCGALAYAELAAALPRSGGEYHFLSQLYHPAIGFLAGWLSVAVGFAAPVALASMALGTYFHAINSTVPPLAVSLGALVAITVAHLFGTRMSQSFQNVATIFKVALILLLIVAGSTAHSTTGISFRPAASDWGLITSGPFAVSLVYVMYSYSGWNASTYIVGEIRNPGRNIPLSTGIGTFIVAALYLGLNAVFLRVAPMNAMQGKLEVAQVASTYLFGPHGGRIMAGLICIGLVSTISAMTWIGPRVGMTIGEDFPAFRWLARKSASGVPFVAILTQAAVVSLLLLTATFDAVLTYLQFSLTLCSVLTVAGVFVLRFRFPDRPRPYETWGYPITPIFFLAVSVWMLWHIAMKNPVESRAGALTILAGLIIYFITRPPSDSGKL